MGELASAILLLLPRTSSLGLLLTSGFWGGAICLHMSHMSQGESFVLQSVFLLITWVGGYLRVPGAFGSFAVRSESNRRTRACRGSPGRLINTTIHRKETCHVLLSCKRGQTRWTVHVPRHFLESATNRLRCHAIVRARRVGPTQGPRCRIAVLREAVAAGVNHIDTSDYYGPHVTNQIIREALHPYPSNLVIVTKLGARSPGRQIVAAGHFAAGLDRGRP